MKIFTDILHAPELTRFKALQRWIIVRSMFQHSRFGYGDRVFRYSFYAAVCLVVLSGLIVDFSHGGFWSALGVVAVLLFVTVCAFALVSQHICRRRLRQFLDSEECQALIRKLEKDEYNNRDQDIKSEGRIIPPLPARIRRTEANGY
jgi:hypothetical protein